MAGALYAVMRRFMHGDGIPPYGLHSVCCRPFLSIRLGRNILLALSLMFSMALSAAATPVEETRHVLSGSAVLHLQYSFWELHNWEILAGIAVFLVQAISIIVLLRQAGRRRRAEAILADQLEFEALTARIASKFIDIPAQLTKAEIESALQELLERLKLDRVSLFEPAGEHEVRLACSRGTANAPPEPTRIGVDQVEWIARQMESGNVVALDSLQGFPMRLPPPAIFCKCWACAQSSFCLSETNRIPLACLPVFRLPEKFIGLQN
jgi:hypothetical protein